MPGTLWEELIRQCGSESIYTDSTIVLISFYKTFGFSPIPEDHSAEYQGAVLILLWRNDGL